MTAAIKTAVDEHADLTRRANQSNGSLSPWALHVRTTDGQELTYLDALKPEVTGAIRRRLDARE